MTTRLGFLYPGHSAEDDLPRAAERVDASVEAVVVHTEMGEDAHRIDALLEIGGSHRLLPGADMLRAAGASVAMWACTSGSFVFGADGARRQVDEVAEHLGIPVSSTSLAFADALAAVDASRVAIAATYPPDVAAAFAAFLRAEGREVVGLGSEDVLTAAEVGTFGRDRVLRFVTAGDHPDADALLVPDTALHTIGLVDELEGELAKPVLTANQVTMWQALRLARLPTSGSGLGSLFAA